MGSEAVAALTPPERQLSMELRQAFSAFRNESNA